MSIVDRIDRDIKVAVMTVSDTRDKTTDKGGKLVIDYIKTVNAFVPDEHYEIVKDEIDGIQKAAKKHLEAGVDVVITTGGTGIAKRDVTIEAVTPLFDKEIEGFGELFRMLSYTEDIGSRSLLSRAAAGTHDNQLIISLPGSSGAVKLAMEKLVIPELNHLVFELNKEN
ncbi:Molybdenum cofactor biosynthesis protein B [Jeotgalicoccus aerolatus]|uniref:Molybdenum cofactor biosynthesis protein B n=1 Tax=Jeotgalicoccus aerolatus TaxID=709510 RepID=A0ABS4HJE9_9STAP|nr:molybdenum cofactor biosynthesis protein B [Jeotgalicoccus aerolatus]MBP1951050.1 molybdenum cofactor biosynthesis protein B [Jeotgalicoccus aerolatus]GGE00629.1 molybdenum cofactor biosynthesis protein B [Jeotgalicoccus aerolatus]CAD2078347.1 Molybdenum cofactor biosynthesis protein B [Jeotgalicoccus aerolatus]